MELNDITMILTDLRYAREQLAQVQRESGLLYVVRSCQDCAERADDALERIESRVKAAAGI